MSAWNEELGRKLREAREAHSRKLNRRYWDKLTIAEVSRELGVHANTLNNWELGKKNIAARDLERLARYYELPYAELVPAGDVDLEVAS